MGVVYILLLIQGITVEIVLYQPQNIVSVEVNRTAVITCVSSEVLDAGLKISWYHRKWRSSEAPILVKSCSSDDDPQKYVCKNEKYKAWLEIHNVQITDSGVYYCMHKHIPYFPQFGNETKLNVRDESNGYVASKCQDFMIPVVTAGTLLVLTLLIHLSRTIKLSDKTAHKDPVMEDQIAYAELNINRLTRLKKTTQTMNSKNII
ncbi:uncharacterized protein LOC120982227 isoform X3 [Bufo bufo]|uniref:uncharacterized protein LOC120982227 isoform X3 n=1 Tax=Bufo bufo TaxID=8384 RepID=UPI001ABDFCD6|nr:uncharacterized protein LOC120982227 isoform X3 [Bufo bufo]